MIEHRDLKVFFSGDTGYFDGFKQIGAKYGPFDLAMIETGAYDKLWPDVHMQQPAPGRAWWKAVDWTRRRPRARGDDVGDV